MRGFPHIEGFVTKANTVEDRNINKATQHKSHISGGMVVQGAPPGDLLECPFLISDLQMASWPHREGPEESVGTDLLDRVLASRGTFTSPSARGVEAKPRPEREVQF